MRNRIFSIIAFLAVLTGVMVACNKKKDILTPPAYGEFATPNTTFSYYIQNDPNSQVKIPVGITNVSNVDRKITIKDSSRTAVNGTQYTLSTTEITIPAGKAVDSLVLKGIYSGYPVGRKDTLYLKISGGDVPANAYNVTYTVIMQGYCAVNITDFDGDYDNTIDTYSSGSKYGPYSTPISNATATSATTGTIVVGNIYDLGPSGITTNVTLNWANPASFTATIPDQPFYSTLWIKGTSGSFSSCAGTVTLSWILYTKSSGATYDVGTTVIKR